MEHQVDSKKEIEKSNNIVLSIYEERERETENTAVQKKTKYASCQSSHGSKEGRVSCSGLNAGSYFISQDEGMTESPVETLEKAIVLHHFWTEGLTSF